MTLRPPWSRRLENREAVVDPVEKIIADALDGAGIAYKCGYERYALDFELVGIGVYIECKQFHSDRISDQMARHENVIAIQGIHAARTFAKMIKK